MRISSVFVFGQVTRPPCAVRLVGMEIFLLYTRLVDPHVKLYFGVVPCKHHTAEALLVAATSDMPWSALT